MNVSDIIDESPVGALHVTIFTLCALCMIMDGFDVQALGYVLVPRSSRTGRSPRRCSPVFAAANLLGVLAGQLTFTMLADESAGGQC